MTGLNGVIPDRTLLGLLTVDLISGDYCTTMLHCLSNIFPVCYFSVFFGFAVGPRSSSCVALRQINDNDN